MKKELEKLDRINAELSRLLKIFRGTFNCDVLLGVWLSIRKELRVAFIRVEEIDSIFCQRVVSCK